MSQLSELLNKLQGERERYCVFISNRDRKEHFYLTHEETTLKYLKKNDIDDYKLVNYNGIVPRIKLKRTTSFYV